MTLAEKITVLRVERRLSQGDLAERLDVSRQSVSKWETGQTVPELEKIIKLADLFGVTVDELVRNGEAPRPPKPQVVYVERERKTGLTRLQTAGVVCAAVGGGMIVVGILGAGVLFIPGVGLIILSLPLLLAKTHPWLIEGWLLAGLGWLVGPYTGLTPLRPLRGFAWIYHYFANPGPGRGAVLLGGTIAAGRDLLTLALVLFTARLLLGAWNARRRRAEPGAAPRKRGQTP